MPCLYSAFYFQHPLSSWNWWGWQGQKVISPILQIQDKGLSDSIKIVGGKASAWIKELSSSNPSWVLQSSLEVEWTPWFVSLCGIRQFQMSAWKAYVLLISQLKVKIICWPVPGKKCLGKIYFQWFRRGAQTLDQLYILGVEISWKWTWALLISELNTQSKGHVKFLKNF